MHWEDEISPRKRARGRDNMQKWPNGSFVAGELRTKIRERDKTDSRLSHDKLDDQSIYI